MRKLTRRDFLKVGASTAIGLGASALFDGVSELSATPSTVHVITGDKFSELYEMSRQAAQAMGIHSGINLSGSRVFIKPNLVCFGQGFYTPFLGDCPKAEILVALAEQCLLAGADKVTIGDASHMVSWNWEKVHFFPGNRIFDSTNIKEAASHLSLAFPTQEIALSCLHEADEWEYIPSSSEHPIMAPGLQIARSFYDSDVMISVGAIKTHQWADISCAMKNLVGTIPAHPPYGFPTNVFMQRPFVHAAYANTTAAGFEKAGIEACFTDILKWRKDAGKQDFAILDCTRGVEGMGPRSLPVGLGTTINIKNRSPIGKYFLLASNDITAVDATAVRIMNQSVDNIRTLLMAQHLGLGEIHNIDVQGDASLDELIISDWRPAILQVDEWGLALSAAPSPEELHTAQQSKIINTVAGITVPAALTAGLRSCHRRKPKCPGENPSPENPSDKHEEK